MLRLRPKWPNAAECCGREVQTNRLGRKRAWWAQGTAIERFEQAIEPEIGAILSNVDLEDADIYFRIYMIGKNEEASRPTIMICCADTSVGRRAKESLRDSSIIRNNPGFCLGSIDFPLEQLVPMRELSHEIEYDSVEILSASGSRSTHDVRVFATSKSATIGRRLFIPHPSTMDIQRYSTGGVVVEAHGQFYQLTVGHITGFPDITLRSSSMDPDACSFDGQNDSEAGDDFSISEQDMRRASMSFVDLSDSGSSDAETERSVSNTINSGSPPFTDCMTTNSDTERCFSPRRNEGLLPGHFIKVGTIMSQSKDGDKRSLDYALVSIQPPQENDNINIVVLDPKRDTGILSVHKVAAVTGGERRIITVTGSGGVMKGNLIPGTTFLKRASQRTPQRLHIVQLDGVVAEGDSGAAVLDEVSGNLYGHVVSGCPGTRVAYIVPATELFESLVTQLAGRVSIPSTSELQKWTAEPSSTDRLFEGLGEKQAPGVPHVDRSHHSQVLTRSPPTIDRSTSIATNQHRSKEGPTDVLSLASSPDGQGIGRHLKNTQRDTVNVPPSSWEASGEKAYQATRRSITLPRGKSAAQNVVTSDQEHSPDLGNPYFLATKISSSSNRGDQVKNGHFRAGGKTRKRILPQRRQIKAQFRDKTRIRARESRSNGEGRGNKQDPHRESYDLSILSLLDENEPFVVGPDDEGSVASLFITGNGLEEGSRFRVELLESFCGSQSLQNFEKSIRMTGSRPTCWIDDRTNDGTKSLPVGECGPLNVRGLYQKLSKKRFFYEIHNTPGSWGITRSSHPEYTPRPSAERRLIFITDIDRHGLTALMATATISQARVLDNVLYKHLAFEADIAASNPSRGWGYCTLYFHLPLYAWRSTPSSIRDSRMRTSGKPFRKVTDVSFLRGKAAPESSREMFDYICQAQVSVLITGIDRCRWTGLCLVDNYFQPQGYREDVNDYHLEEHDILFDPITAGAYCADTPLLDPSEYFLAVLEVRIGRFQQGWQETISSLEMRINEYISLWEPVDFTNHTVSMESYRLKEDLLWVVRAKRLLRTLSHCLRTTIEYRKSFTPTKDAFETPFCHKTLVSIQKVFIDLGVYADRLEAAYTKCDDFSNQLNLYMRCEELRHQMEASKNSRTVSYFLLYILSPVTIAAAMLSMQEKAIPSFLGPSKFSFLILAPVLGLSVYAISACISNWTQIQLFIKHSLGSEKTALDREEITLPV